MHGRARYLAPCVAALLFGSTTGLADGARGPRDSLTALATAKRSAVLELYAAEASLARAHGALAQNVRRLRSLEQERSHALIRSAVVRRSLAATHERIATLLRRLYVDGESDPVAVILGARSLSAVLEGVDSLERATRRNRELADEARQRRAALRRELERLARSRAALRSSRQRSERLVAGLAAATAEKRSTLASLQRREELTRARLAALEAKARAAERASRRLAPRPHVSDPAPTAVAASVRPPAPPVREETDEIDLASTDEQVQPPAPMGARTLVVDAVAYHLPGTTASGLPVGVGVIAVDPAVIPLGTRVFVPGYGPAVAADVGSAIKGNIIDLWMPSTAAARAWGRRTVTITVYG
jgi:3D (Asp-Asp-Asp) domain-containing protein